MNFKKNLIYPTHDQKHEASQFRALSEGLEDSLELGNRIGIAIRAKRLLQLLIYCGFDSHHIATLRWAPLRRVDP
ncbi:MAG: hypothetical protein CFE44_22650 [Burkholderiales bacterium PBB4]|nr:MAG: hypothetical protein CFE44_22650 [Burkholderiales bacterium PBB4]